MPTHHHGPVQTLDTDGLTAFLCLNKVGWISQAPPPEDLLGLAAETNAVSCDSCDF